MKKQRRFITLVEIMIVIAIIGIIGAVMVYNLSGSLDEGKAFKTREGAKQIVNVLNLEVAKGTLNMEEVPSTWQQTLKNSPLVSKPDKLKLDGWGNLYEVLIEKGEIVARSSKYEDYTRSKQLNDEEYWK